MTLHAGYAITGKTFVGPAGGYQSQGPLLATDPLATGDGGNLIAAAAPTAGGPVAGVAMWDVVSGGKVVVIRGVGVFLPVTSGAAVTIGDYLKVDTSGRVVTAAQTTAGSQPANWVVGVAHSTVGAAALDVVVELIAPFKY
jgi:hypothetical protein